MSSTAIRGKDWVFNALWTAADLTRKCALTIPLTSIFKDGMPFKVLTTDFAGNIRRVDLEKVELDRMHHAGSFRGENLRLLFALRRLLEEYASDRGYHVFQRHDGDPFLVKVYYTDGQMEDLSGKTLEVLMRNKNWRLQVLMIQGYVPTLSTQTGIYSKQPRVRSLVDADKTATADQLTASVAKFIERAYTQQTGELLGQSSGTGAPVQLHVENLTCSFCLDHKDTCVFLFADYTAVEIEKNRQGVEEHLRTEKEGREAAAAQNVLSELKGLLLHAHRQRLPAASSFQHFDTSQSGYMDVDMLIDGLARLGVGVTYPVAEKVMDLMGGMGCSFMTLSDFETFLERLVESDSLYSNTNVAKATVSPKRPVQQQSASPPKVKNKDLLPPAKDWRSIGKSFGDISASQAFSWREEEVEDEVTELQLPLPEDQYTSRPAREQSTDMLPTWARTRSRRTLETILRSERKGTQRSAVDRNVLFDASLTSAPGSPATGSGTGQRRNDASLGKRKAKKVSAKTGLSSTPVATMHTLQTVRDGILADQVLHSSKDELLHLESGVVMTFRVLDGLEISKAQKRTKEEVDALRYHSVLSLREENLNKFHEPNGDGLAEGKNAGPSQTAPSSSSTGRLREEVSVTLVVVPDLTMTLDTLQLQLQHFVNAFPFARVVLVGLLGLPNTVWPVQWVLNSDLQARTIAHLVLHLHGQKRLFFREDTAQQHLLFLGYGLGGFHLSRFLCQHLHSLPTEVTAACRVAVLANAFLRISKRFRAIAKDLRTALLHANVSEAHELISSLHFSDDYLTANARPSCLQQFWASRRNLLSTDALEANPAVRTLSGFLGVLEQLKGVLASTDDFDGAMVLVDTQLPLVVVQGTEDVFVDPQLSTAVFTPSQLPPTRHLVSDVIDVLEDNAVYLTMVRAGHEINQERSAFVLALLSSLAKLLGAGPRVAEAVVVKEQAVEFNPFDVLGDDWTYGKDANEDARQSAMLPDSVDLQAADFSTTLQLPAQVTDAASAAYSASSAFEGSQRAAMSVASTGEGGEEAAGDEEDDDEDGAGVQQKARRAQMHLERKKRQMKQNRQQQLELYYQREREEKERRCEQRETKIMTQEDQRSRHAAEYALQCEITEISQRIAREKVTQLKRLRDEEAAKQAEEERAFQRAARIEERRKQAQSLIKRIEEEELSLQGMREGGYDLPQSVFDINGALEASHRILRDLMECRQKYVEAISRQALLQDKFEIYKKQLASLESDEKRLRRAIRLIEINPTVVGKDMNAEAQLAELRASLYHKQTTLQEMAAVSREREQQLYSANRNVQLLKLASKERDTKMQVRLQELHQLEASLNDKLKELKMVKEGLVITKDRLRMQMLTHQKRLDVVEKELNRIKSHKGKLVDTDVWMEGVLQRCVTKELRQHLTTEIAKAQDAKRAVAGELEGLRQRIFEATERIAQAKRDVDKVSSASSILHKSFIKFSATPVAEIASNFRKLKAKAEQLELQRSKTADIDKVFLHAQSDSLVDKVRLKESEIRTKDERQFVGLDLIVNPQEYLHLSPVEIEQMSFDADYQCTLARTDIERILKLPEPINLALPFLHTPEEINAHRLLTHFVKGMDEAFFVNKDFVVGVPVATAAANASGAASVRSADHYAMADGRSIATKTVEEAEQIHDVLIKEALRDRLRASYADEGLTDDEKRWVEMDKLLAPHIYGLDGTENQAAREQDLHEIAKQENIVAMTTSSITPAQTKGRARIFAVKLSGAKEGDVYQPLRELFQVEGRELFYKEFPCSFSRNELLRIHNTPRTSVMDAKERDAKALLDKYFVSDEESVMGHSKLAALVQVTTEINAVVARAETGMEEALKANRLEFERLDSASALDASAMLTDRSQLSIDSVSAAPRGPLSGIPEESGADIKRIWGAWTSVHPASQGKESQTAYFSLSGFNSARDHPACFGLHDELPDEELTDDEGEDGESVSELASQPPASPRQRALTLLKRRDVGSVRSGSHQLSKLMGRVNDPKSQFFIASSVEELAQQDSRILRGKLCLLQERDTMTLFELQGASIQTRQSRSHYFTIPDREAVRILELTVSVVFQGIFSTTGYRLGRLAASLFRLPPEASDRAGSHQMPTPVGYTPYDTISPNLPDSLGKLTIYHKPQNRPLAPGTFQLIVGAASATVYSVVVHAKYARTALPVVDEQINEAKNMQSRLPKCLDELDGIAESLRLAERKLLVCEKMIQEAEVETDRCQRGMGLLREKIDRDDEDMTMMEDERRDVQRELSIFEIEYSQWARVFASRCREKEDIKEGVDAMVRFRRQREEEKEKITKGLEAARRDLPACIRILRTMTEAVNVAMALNTEVVGVSDEAGAAATGDWGGIRVSTPAEDVRRVLKQFGFAALMLEEQQWCLLDQQLHPHKYEWLREKEEKERVELARMGKKPKDDKFNPALEPFKLSKSEIEYILETPFSMLNRREVIVRKILTKYHDDADFMKKAISAAAYSFDPHLAERVRAKNPKSYSKEEREWASVDRVLHPEVWAFYVHRSENFMDRHGKEAAIEHANAKTKGKKSRQRRKGDASVPTADSTTQGTADGVAPAAAVASESAPSAAQRLVDMQAVIDLQGEDINAVIDRLQQTTHIKLRAAADAARIAASGGNGEWTCHLSREEIFRIWRTPRHFLKTDDERRIYKLLMKFNGAHAAYQDTVAQSERRKAKAVKSGEHIQWEKLGKIVSKDTDFRARQLLREIDRAASTRNEWIHSDVLHANDQKFPTIVLRRHLEDALDNLLIEQVRDRERADKYKMEIERGRGADGSDDEDLLAGEEGAGAVVEVEGAGGAPGDAELLSKVTQRVQRRQQHKEEAQKVVKETDEELVLKTKALLAKKKSGQELADLLLESQLGAGSCLACRHRRCRWKRSIDMEVCSERKRVLDNEIERVRLDKDSAVFDSSVALSAQLGGNTVFRRQDLLDELNQEIADLSLRMNLSNVDKELHDAYATRKEFFESEFLHGYRLMLWTTNARKALEAYQSRLVAMIVSKEVVGDILDHMLEGWVFGERQSQFQVLGYVPSVKRDGMVRAGQDQVNSVVTVVRKMKERADAKRAGVLADEARRGQMMDKAFEVELQAQAQRQQVKVARDGNEHQHLLDETESTLKFGLFMLTLMYFRAMTFLKREQRSWSGEGEEVGVRDRAKASKALTDERMRMIDEENKVLLRQKKIDLILAKSRVGEQRRRDREAAERKEAISRMQAIIRRQKLEVASISLVQKVYRGHLGRKAAKRWALKRAELGAMNALLNATAVAIQRVYRGYKARCYAVVKRMEMAQFIALMRVQESAQDEEVYWQTHPWSRFKKRQKEWVAEKLEAYRARKIMGGARLSAEEQAELEGKTLEEIKAEIEGLGEEEDLEMDLDMPEEDEPPSRHLPGAGASTRGSTRSGRSTFSRADSALSSALDDDDLLDDDDA